MKQQFYQGFSPKEKKDIKEKVLGIAKLRKQQIEDIDATLCKPLRHSVYAAQRLLKNEISLESYLLIEDAAQKHQKELLKFFERGVGK